MPDTNYMEAAFAPAERVYKRTVAHETFGHLRAPAEVVYRGWILFTHGCCGDITVIDYDFVDPEGKEVAASPWIWEHIVDFVGKKVLPDGAIKDRIEGGTVCRWEGTYSCAEDRPKSEGSHIMIEGKPRFRGSRQPAAPAVGRPGGPSAQPGLLVHLPEAE